MKKWLLLLTLLFLGFYACDSLPTTGSDGGNALQKQEKKNPNYICDMISNKIHSFSFLMKVGNKQSEHIREETLDAYNANDYELLWQNEQGNTYSPNIEKLLSVLRKADEHGLNPADYKADIADTLFNQIYNQQKFKDEQIKLNKIDLDLSLTAAALTFISDLSHGRLEHKWDIPKSKSDLSNMLIVALNQNDITKIVEQIQPKHTGYPQLVEEFNRYKEIKKQGGLPKVKTSSISWNKSSKAVGNLARYFYLTGDYSEKVEKGASVKYDKKIKDALKRFQKRHGQIVTGTFNKKTIQNLNVSVDDILKKIELNLERYRWLPDDMGERYVFVNVPEFMIHVIDNQKEEMTIKAVVGDVASRTEVFTKPMTHLVFSPIWNIPQSISRDDIISWLDVNPGILYVGDVLSYYKGKLIKDPYAVDWKEARKDWRNYTFKQQPTELNSLGDVKFMFPNKYSIYLHDTPAKEAFSEHYRSISHGCIRVEKPVDLAAYLLKDKKEWSRQRIINAMSGTKQRWAHLSKDVPVYLYYLTAWVDKDGVLNFRPDLYRHDKRQLAKL